MIIVRIPSNLLPWLILISLIHSEVPVLQRHAAILRTFAREVEEVLYCTTL